MLKVKYKIWLLGNSCTDYVAGKFLRTNLILLGHELQLFLETRVTFLANIIVGLALC